MDESLFNLGVWRGFLTMTQNLMAIKEKFDAFNAKFFCLNLGGENTIKSKGN